MYTDMTFVLHLSSDVCGNRRYDDLLFLGGVGAVCLLYFFSEADQTHRITLIKSHA